MRYQLEQQISDMNQSEPPICRIDYKNKYAVSIKRTNKRFQSEPPICGID